TTRSSVRPSTARTKRAAEHPEGRSQARERATSHLPTYRKTAARPHRDSRARKGERDRSAKPRSISLITKSRMPHPRPPPRGEGRGPTSQIHSRGAEQLEMNGPFRASPQRVLVQNSSSMRL